LLGALRQPRFLVAHFTHLTDALTYLKINPVDMVLVGAKTAEMEMLGALRKLSAAFPEVPMVALTERASPAAESAVKLAGARECLVAQDLTTRLLSRTLEFCHREMAVSRELATVTARLDWMMHTDSLTGLLNRKGMEQVIMDELVHCRRENRDLLILLVDLDDFSRINATLGLGVGDLVLVGASRRISESIREQDKVGRCGTDRFVVMLPGTDLAEGEGIAENIRLAVGRDVIQAGDNALTTTASIGVTGINPTCMSFDEVLAKAHFVLQRSKLQGKNRVSRAATVAEVEMIRPVEVGPEMIRALLRGNVLEVASQPIVNLVDGRIVSREMLIRGPEGPLRRPDNLFRYCQEKDILAAVDLRCLKLCAREAARQDGGGRYHVNIMPATLLQTPAEELIRVLSFNKSYGHCCLEISEQQLLGDPSVLVHRVRLLQEAGIRIAIDDVGFGNSCLEGLVMLQPQVMKIDKRLVRGIAAESELQGALARMLKVANALGAEVVAEGIEDAEDYRLLLDLGVRYGQGYLFGKPELCNLEAAETAGGDNDVATDSVAPIAVPAPRITRISTGTDAVDSPDQSDLDTDPDPALQSGDAV